jgi:hypothetical protein
MTRAERAAILLMAICLAWTAHGQEPSSRPATPTTSAAVNPDAIAALDRMSAYLRTLRSFHVQSTISREDVLQDGQKVAVDGAVDLLLQRPNRFRVELATDAQHRMFYYDGKSFTIWARRVNYYASVPAPPTIAELTNHLETKYGVELPLADLFYWATGKLNVSNLASAIDAGPSQVTDVTCEHYVFRQDGMDWQVWIQSGEYPLPRKLIVTTTTDDARPQYTSVMTWNLAPAFNDAAFVFTAPAEAHRIALADVESSHAPVTRR